MPKEKELEEIIRGLVKDNLNSIVTISEINKKIRRAAQNLKISTAVIYSKINKEINALIPT